MPEVNLFKMFTNRFNALGVEYFVTGAVAAIVYGEPRLTHDIDIVIQLKKRDAALFAQAFPLDEFYCPPVEIIQLEAERPLRGHFNIIHHRTGFKADIYNAGRDNLHGWAMSNRRAVDLEGDPIWLAPPEYVILRKLEYYGEGRSEKHLRDIAGILAYSREQIDFDKLQDRIESRHLSKEWQEALSLADQ